MQLAENSTSSKSKVGQRVRQLDHYRYCCLDCASYSLNSLLLVTMADKNWSMLLVSFAIMILSHSCVT